MSAAPAYGAPARVLHWLTVALVLCMFGLGLSMVRMEAGDLKLRVYGWHEWTGITIFGLTAFRLAWRLRHPPPPHDDLPRLMRFGAACVHAAIYVLLFAVPLTGWAMSAAFGFPVVYLGLVTLPMPVAEDRALAVMLRRVHVTLAFTLAGLVVHHAAAALFHHFVRRDGVLARMIPALRR